MVTFTKHEHSGKLRLPGEVGGWLNDHLPEYGGLMNVEPPNFLAIITR